MISIIITSSNEINTIGKAIESVINQDFSEDYELIVVSPDNETLEIAKNYGVKFFKDPKKGKSYALNLILKEVRGDILILTDGDVYVSENSVNEILKFFKDERVGCVTGRPFPIEDKKNKYGYWANFLFESAHRMRKRLHEEKKFLECSGYLWAFRNGHIREFPCNVAEDTVIPYLFFEKGYKIGYAEKALVYVKNVDNWKDWINQKKRTSKGHETLCKHVDIKKIPRSKTFLNESKGLLSLFLYPSSIKELLWSVNLLFARFYMWGNVFFETYLKKDKYSDNWKRVESTK